MKALTKKVFKDITRRKLRTAMTILGIAIGIIGLSAINIASSQFESSLAYSTNITAQPDMQLYTIPTSPNLANVLSQQPNVKTVQARGNIVTNWAIGSNQVLIQVYGILDFQHIHIGRFTMVEGKLPGPNQIVLEESDKALDNVQIGNQIAIQVGRTYRNVTISGFARTQGLPSASITGMGQGYMGESAFETLFQVHGVTDFAVQVKNYALRYDTAKQLAQVLSAHKAPTAGIDIGRDTSVSSIANGLFTIMDVLSAIAILLSIILLLGTIMGLVTEQVQYIGTMKAIGGRRGQIMRHYMAVVTIYGAIGTAIGIVVGTAGGYLLANYLGNLVNLDIGPLQVSPWQILESVAIGLGVPLLAAVLPVYFGTRITVKQALSGYGVESGAARQGKLWTHIARFVFGVFPQTVQFGVRGLFRKRTRMALTLVTLSIAGAAFLAVQTASYSFNNFLSQTYDTYHFDVMVSVSDVYPLSRFQQALASVPNISRIEPLSQNTVSTRWGNAQLTGVPLDTQLYQKQVLAGRWFAGSDKNDVIISKDAADNSGLKVGDNISLDTPLTSARWHIIGIIKDYSGIGPGNLGTLIAPIAQVNTLMQVAPNVTQTVMIRSTFKVPTQAQINTLAQQVNNAMSAAGFLPNTVTAQQLIAQSQSKYQVIYTMLDVVAIVIALVGAIALANTLAMSVLERRREIGILRSMGAVGRKVASVFWAEGTAVGMLAWALALVLGFPAAYGFVQIQAHVLAPVPFAFDPLNLVWMLVIIVALASLASVGPVFASARVKIAQTLRYE